MQDSWRIQVGDGPLIATAIHDGHGLRPEIAGNIKISDADRLREEDPYTSTWVDVADTNIVALRSRFEFDLNRPRDKAVYVTPEDCWGLDGWKTKPTDGMIDRSLAEYDSYYAELKNLLKKKEAEHGRFVVLDLHSFNHRRNGAEAEPDSPEETPEINIGTGTMDRDRWGSLVDRFINDLSTFDFMGRNLDVRENIKFKGGNQVEWIHENFRNTGCGIAVEFKKFWMDEWTGEKDLQMIAALHNALSSTIPGLLEEVEKH